MAYTRFLVASSVFIRTCPPCPPFQHERRHLLSDHPPVVRTRRDGSRPSLAQRNTRGVRADPILEGLQRGIQVASHLRRAVAAERLAEQRMVLEHVAHI